MKIVLPALALLSLIAVENRAHASTQASGYVCSTIFYPGASVNGNSGYMTANVYSGPNCTGSYLSGYTWCSTGATSSACTPWPLTESQENALWENLRAAAQTAQKITVWVVNSNAWVVQFGGF